MFGISQNPNILKINTIAKRIAPSDAPVFIFGETGTGKEVLARTIHAYSNRVRSPFVTVNCAAIPESLIESEIFGHTKGAFTGAFAHAGLLDQAHKGTLFLDEIADMSLMAQAKILTTLETKFYRPVGGTIEQYSDFRIISATNGKISNLRADLRFRICVIIFELPPLRERKEDIIYLAEFFLKSYESFKALSTGAKNKLLAHYWPGNIRELKYIIQRADLMSKGDTIFDDDISFKTFASTTLTATAVVTPLVELERNEIIHALRVANGLQKDAARLLGITARTLCYKIRHLQIDLNDL